MGSGWGTFPIKSPFKPVNWFGAQSDIPLSRTELIWGIFPLKNRGRGRFCAPTLWISRVWRFGAKIEEPREVSSVPGWYTFAASFRTRGM